MPDPQTLTAVVLVFLLAGTIKGIIGLGLPTVSLALLTVAIDLPSAMALLLAPSFLTNVWQAVIGGHAGSIFRRLWIFLFMATITVWIGALALTRIDLGVLSAILGFLLITYAALNLGGYQLKIEPRQERWIGPLSGAVNGVLTGMTGSFVVPGVMYLQALGLPRDMLIQAMGMLFTVSTIALGVALHGNQMLTADLGTLSMAAVLPAILGMWFGSSIRQRMTEQTFRFIFFSALLVLGIYIVANALV